MHYKLAIWGITAVFRAHVRSPIGKITVIFSNTSKKNKIFSVFGLIIYLQSMLIKTFKAVQQIDTLHSLEFYFKYLTFSWPFSWPKNPCARPSCGRFPWRHLPHRQ